MCLTAVNTVSLVLASGQSACMAAHHSIAAYSTCQDSNPHAVSVYPRLPGMQHILTKRNLHWSGCRHFDTFCTATAWHDPLPHAVTRQDSADRRGC